MLRLLSSRITPVVRPPPNSPLTASDHILDLQAALVLLDARLEKTHGGPDDFLKLPPVEKMDHDRDADRGQSCKHDGV